MSYTVQNVNSCTKRISFELPNVDLKPHVQKALQQKQQTVELKGYRKGKAPISVIEKFYGPQVENEALSRYIYEQIDTAVKSEGINPVDYPRIEKADYKAPKLNFEAVVEFFPSIQIKDLSKYTLTKQKTDVEEEDITSAKNKYLQSRSTLEQVQDEQHKAIKGDVVQINFEGTLKDGEKPENMKGVDYPLELGSGNFIAGFEDGLIGCKKGDKKTLKLTFPKDYHVEKLQNEVVAFDVEIVSIKQKKIPLLDESMAKELGFDTLDQMEETIKNTVKAQKEKSSREKLEKDLLDQLSNDYQFDVPEIMVQNQKKSLMDQILPGLTRSGFSEAQVSEYMSKWDKEMNDKAIFQVKTALILDQISKDHKIEVTPDDIENKYKEIAQNAGMTVEDVKNYYKKDKNIYRNLFYNIKEQKTFDKVFGLIKIK